MAITLQAGCRPDQDTLRPGDHSLLGSAPAGPSNRRYGPAAGPIIVIIQRDNIDFRLRGARARRPVWPAVLPCKTGRPAIGTIISALMSERHRAARRDENLQRNKQS